MSNENAVIANEKAVASNVVTITKRVLSPEEKAQREAARKANLEALAPFIDEARRQVSQELGMPLDLVIRMHGVLKDIGNAINHKARALLEASRPASEKGTTGVRGNGKATPKWLDKSLAFFVRSILFARSHNVTDDQMQDILEKAFEAANSPTKSSVANAPVVDTAAQ